MRYIIVLILTITISSQETKSEGVLRDVHVNVGSSYTQFVQFTDEEQVKKCMLEYLDGNNNNETVSHVIELYQDQIITV